MGVAFDCKRCGKNDAADSLKRCFSHCSILTASKRLNETLCSVYVGHLKEVSLVYAITSASHLNPLDIEGVSSKYVMKHMKTY